MLAKLKEALLPFIIGVVIHSKEKLANKEEKARNAFLNNLLVEKRKTTQPIIIAMVGLVGSGKSTIARTLASLIGGTIIEGDAIRVELRKERQAYTHARLIAEDVTQTVIDRGGNVILDSDFIDPNKRASMRKKAQKAGVRLIFIRTYSSDPDISIGRMLSAPYKKEVNDFFGGAESNWNGSEQSIGATVKIKEMWRRTPHHYRWTNPSGSGGRWVLKKLPFSVFAEIDTSSKTYEQVIKDCAKQLLTY